MFSIRTFFKLGDKSYLDLGKQVVAKTLDDGCSEYAAAMAYYLLFALFPFFLFLTTLIGYLPIPGLLQAVLDNMQQILPDEVFTLVQDNVRKLFGNKKAGLLSLGFVLAVWTSSNAITAIMNIMNRLYLVKEGRPFWKVRLVAIFLIASVSILFLLALLLLMFAPKVGSLIAAIAYLGKSVEIAITILLVPLILFLLMCAVSLIFYFTPDVEQDWKWISPGSVVSIPVWIGISLAFSYYINNFGSYDKTYGSIGAVIVLLLWLYISGFVILIGAEINTVVEHNSEEGKEPGEKVEGEHEQVTNSETRK